MTTRYTKSHEYVRVEGGTGVVGITDYAQSQLGDVVFVELPPIGQSLSKGAEAATVESVKAASEVNAPVPARSSMSTAYYGFARIGQRGSFRQGLVSQNQARRRRRNRQPDGRRCLSRISEGRFLAMAV